MMVRTEDMIPKNMKSIENFNCNGSAVFVAVMIGNNMMQRKKELLES